MNNYFDSRRPLSKFNHYKYDKPSGLVVWV